MGPWERTEAERKISKALEEVAKQVGAKSIQAGQSTHAENASTHTHLPHPQWPSRT